MKAVCGECGSEIPEDMDFCPKCGSLKGKATTYGDNPVCLNCGTIGAPGDEFCSHCGSRFSNFQPMPKADAKRASIAFFLALIPGLFNVFGIGHLYLKSYARGAAFLTISVILFYINGWRISGGNMGVFLVTLVVFFIQATDIMKIAGRRNR